MSAFVTLQDVRIEDFKRICAQQARAEDYPLAAEVLGNVPVYQARTLRNSDRHTVMNELHRVMHPEGVLRIEVPTFDPTIGNFSAFQDPTHKMYWVPNTFFYFELGNMHYDEFGKYYGIQPWKFLPSPPPSPEDPLDPSSMRRFMQPVKPAPSPTVVAPVKKSWLNAFHSWFGKNEHSS